MRVGDCGDIGKKIISIYEGGGLGRYWTNLKFMRAGVRGDIEQNIKVIRVGMRGDIGHNLTHPHI